MKSNLTHIRIIHHIWFSISFVFKIIYLGESLLVNSRFDQNKERIHIVARHGINGILNRGEISVSRLVDCNKRGDSRICVVGRRRCRFRCRCGCKYRFVCRCMGYGAWNRHKSREESKAKELDGCHYWRRLSSKSNNVEREGKGIASHSERRGVNLSGWLQGAESHISRRKLKWIKPNRKNILTVW